MATASVLGRWIFLFIFKGHRLGFARNALTPLGPHLLIILEKIGKKLQTVCSTIQYGARALLAPVGKII
jgi:hypothetical protein